MGYYTTFELETDSDKIKEYGGSWEFLEKDPVIIELRKSCEETVWCLSDEGLSEDSTKWYSHEEDLKEFSKEHPKVLFTLSGKGEENNDIWIKYFKNGKMQACYAEIKIPPFDEDELK